MASLNKVMLIGNLGKDPDVKYSGNGLQIANFSIATNSSYKKGDSWLDKTEWHNIVAFDKLAERANELLKKGSTVYIEGRLQTRNWQDDNGMRHYRTEVVARSMQILSGKPAMESGAEGYPVNKNNSSSPFNPPINNDPMMDDTEDDLPF